MQHPGARRSRRSALGLCALLALWPAAARADEPSGQPALRAKPAQTYRDLYVSYLTPLLLDEFQLTYRQAHQLALRIEREATLALHFSWETYDRHMEGIIDEVGRRRPERVPPGLDMTPYESYSDPETVALRLQMQRAQMQRPIPAP